MAAIFPSLFDTFPIPVHEHFRQTRALYWSSVTNLWFQQAVNDDLTLILVTNYVLPVVSLEIIPCAYIVPICPTIPLAPGQVINISSWTELNSLGTCPKWVKNCRSQLTSALCTWQHLDVHRASIVLLRFRAVIKQI